MAHNDLFDQLLQFRSDTLKKVSTTVTTENGQQFVETLQDGGHYAVSKSGHSAGFVVDNNADITVSLVMQGLILGSQDVAMEPKILNDFNVTHILNVGYKIPNYFESKFIYKNVEILDDPSTNIRMFFDGCFQFIDDGRQEGCILVHCNAGLSRAPTLVIAYLMKKYNMRLKEAYALVKSVRSNIKPNEGFMKVLEDYDNELFVRKRAGSEVKEINDVD